jgi:hypothetical protein
MKGRSTFPGISMPAKTDPLAGKDLDALKGVAAQAPVSIGALERAKEPPKPVIEPKPASDLNVSRPAAARAPVASKRPQKEGTIQIAARLPVSLVEAIRFLKEKEDRSEAWVINEYAASLIKEAARKAGWQG